MDRNYCRLEETPSAPFLCLNKTSHHVSVCRGEVHVEGELGNRWGPSMGLTSVVDGEIMPVSSAHTYIMMHFYFLNDRFQDFFPASIPLYGQAIIAFVITFILAYVISKGAARFKQMADNYLLVGR
jgi:hypothetical protein